MANKSLIRMCVRREARELCARPRYHLMANRRHFNMDYVSEEHLEARGLQLYRHLHAKRRDLLGALDALRFLQRHRRHLTRKHSEADLHPSIRFLYSVCEILQVYMAELKSGEAFLAWSKKDEVGDISMRAVSILLNGESREPVTGTMISGSFHQKSGPRLPILLAPHGIMTFARNHPTTGCRDILAAVINRGGVITHGNGVSGKIARGFHAPSMPLAEFPLKLSLSELHKQLIWTCNAR